MKRKNIKIEQLKKFVIIFSLFFLVSTPLYAAAQMFFETPQKAVDALISAAKGEKNFDAGSVMGEEGKDIVSSGDPVADKKEREVFVQAYEKKHNIVIAENENVATLFVGLQDWPMPIPIVKREAGWQFDTAEGKQELLYRRVGRNELNTIQVMQAYVDAQNDYLKIMMRENKKPIYAQRIISSEGKHDGLYWPVSEGEAESPMGELLAEASAEGYGDASKNAKGHTPYHGYYYRILTGQGPSARGGAIDYIAHDQMIGGFGMVAWPASYGNSGVMTFIVNHDGIVYQRDLGSDTEKEVSKIKTFDPNPEWQLVEEEKNQ
jgi:hypothetical protein